MIDLFHSYRVPHPAFLESYGTRIGYRLHGDSKVVEEKKSNKNLNLLTFVICRPTKKQKEVQMDHITLGNGEEEGFVFSVGALMERLENLVDTRKARGKRYTLPFLMIVILLAKLAGEDTPKGIAEWLKLRRRQVVAAFNSKRDTVPAYNTIRRTLADTVSESELQQAFVRFLHQCYGEDLTWDDTKGKNTRCSPFGSVFT
jgi:hypothetical protein